MKTHTATLATLLFSALTLVAVTCAIGAISSETKHRMARYTTETK